MEMIFQLMEKITKKKIFPENELKEEYIVQKLGGFLNADVNGAANILRKVSFV